MSLDLPFGNLIRGIARSQTAGEREVAAAAYLLALAAQRQADHPDDRLAVAAMSTRTRKELLGKAPPGTRGRILGRLADALVAGSDLDCVAALRELGAWYAERARCPEAREVAGVAKNLAAALADPVVRIEADTDYGWFCLHSGGWKEATRAFRKAIELSERHGWRKSEIRGELGIVHVELHRGRTQKARERALRAWGWAQELGDPGLVGLCGHALLAVEQEAQNFERALEYGWNTLSVAGLSASPASLLVDCSRLFRTLGARGTARRVAEAALRHPLSKRERLEAEIGLLELEVMEGNEVAFLGRKKALEDSADLEEVLLLHAHFWITVGRGYRLFGKNRAAERALEEAARWAEEEGLGPVLMEVDHEVEALRGAARGEGSCGGEPTAALEKLARKFGGTELG